MCSHEQTQIVASAACRVGSQEFHSWIASLPLVSFYCEPYSLFKLLKFFNVHLKAPTILKIPKEPEILQI